VTAADQHVARVEVDPTGKVTIVVGKPGDVCDNKNNEWDEVFDRGQRKT
jgi:hypothetical protein